MKKQLVLSFKVNHMSIHMKTKQSILAIVLLVLAMIAWQDETAAKPPAPLRDGFTASQRFFIGFAQWACESARPEKLRIDALTNPHSPGRYRVNGVVANLPEFEKAFSCKPGQPMVAPRRCKVW